MERIHELARLYADKVIAWRRHIHQHPELSGQEKETSAFVAAALREMGLEPVENIGGFGVSALIHGTKPGRCVGLRADMDALPILEQTGLPFASVNEGICHACGHDCHTAMLLGVASVLNTMRDSFAGTVKLVFQPSEENPLASGAKAIIADGVLENPHVDAMFGQHMAPGVKIGAICTKKGPATAASDRFFITVCGKNAHGSEPDKGIDAITIAAQVISSLQQIASRQVSPLKNTVLTIGTIHGGERYNVIPGEVKMEGTCRNTSPDVRNSMPERMESIIKGVTEGLGGTYAFEYIKGYSPLVNDSELSDLMLDIAEKEVEAATPVREESAKMGGEDFSFYTEKIPGAFYWLGCTDTQQEGPAYPLHNGKFAPDESAFAIGVEMLATAAVRYLNGTV